MKHMRFETKRMEFELWAFSLPFFKMPYKQQKKKYAQEGALDYGWEFDTDLLLPE
jgi:hypothetical protein